MPYSKRVRHWALIFAGVHAFGWVLALPAAAQRVVYVDGMATGANDGSSWESAYVNLQDALADAAASGASSHEIRVARGTYRPDQGIDQTLGERTASFELFSGLALLGGYAGCASADPDARDRERFETILSGDLSGNDDPAIRGESDCCGHSWTPGCDDALCEEEVCTRNPFCCEDWWASSCANAAEQYCCDLCRPTRCENSYTVVKAMDTDASTRIDGFTITGGESNGSFEPKQPGFDMNLVTGGGLYVRDSSLTVSNCTFVRNAAGGGGNAVDTRAGEPVVTNCMFRDNGWYAHGAGSALWTVDEMATVTDCQFIRNRGGGLRVRGDRLISGCSFVGNTRSAGLDVSRGHPSISDCIFIGNTGGGMFNFGFPQLINCGFYGNSTGFAGGGIHDAGWGLILINCVFSGNKAGGGIIYPGGPTNPGYGGGISKGSGPLLVLNCTIVGNEAGSMGGLSGLESATIAHSIFWGNRSDKGITEGSQLGGGWFFTPPQIRYNCIQGWTGSVPGLGNVGVDPLFVDADGPDDVPGTQDDDFHLSADSLLIDAGDPNPPLLPPYDFELHTRILCGVVDMGVYEFGIGDLDCDRSVDLTDFSQWAACMTGPDNGPYPETCEAFDFNADNDVDVDDFRGFQLTLAHP